MNHETYDIVNNDREVAEWSKAHDWNSCMGQLIEGSNPFLSAMKFIYFSLSLP